MRAVAIMGSAVLFCFLYVSCFGGDDALPNSGDEGSNADAGFDAGGDTDTDDGNDTGSDSESDTDTWTGVDTNPDTDTMTDTDLLECPPNTPVPNGVYCHSDAHCTSKLCISYQQVPPDPEGHCEQNANPNGILAIGTTLDIETGEPVLNASLDIYDAMQLSLMGCNAVPFASTTSDADGRFWEVIPSPATALVGIVVTAKTATGYAISAIAQDETANSFENRDILMVTDATLSKWSAMLAEDPQMEPYMPLGNRGGTIGIIRRMGSAAPIEGAELRSMINASNAKIRYLNADGTGFVDGATTSSGIFVLVAPALAEKFDVYVNNVKVNITSLKLGDTDCMVFMINYFINCWP